MSDRKARRTANACTAQPGERLVRCIIGVIVAVFAVAFAPVSPVIGIAAGVIAIGIGAMAITGFCPADWLRTRTQQRIPENSLGYADARTAITLNTLSKEHSS